MANRRILKRMESLILNVAAADGVAFGIPVKEKLKMFLDGRLVVKDIATGNILDPMKYEWARMIDGEHYNKYPVYQVICRNGQLERAYLPYNTISNHL